MHAANLSTSLMLQEIHSVLLDYQPHSTKEIADKTGCECVGTRIQELKHPKNGLRISCVYKGMTEKRNKVFEYQLLPF